MFFLSKEANSKSYTLINNSFFENVLPHIERAHVKIFMYIYFISNNKETTNINTLDDIGKKLAMTKEEVLSSLDYLEKINLIRKHFTGNGNLDEYDVEVLNLEKYNSESDNLFEEEYLNETDDNLRNMYQKIEDIIKVPLSIYDMKKLEARIKNSNLSYELVVEAYKLLYYEKRSTSTNEVLKMLKDFKNRGIITTTDLDEGLGNINERYNIHRKILKYFGEYRLPTKPEMEKMDKWLDEYNFHYDVIEKAIDECLKIKSPNFKYIDGTLSNWYNIYNEYKGIFQVKDKDFESFQEEILSILGINKINEKQEKMLKFILKSFPKNQVLEVIKGKDTLRGKSIEELFLYITGKENFQFGSIRYSELKPILNIVEAENRKTESKKIESSKDKVPLSKNQVTIKNKNSKLDKMKNEESELMFLRNNPMYKDYTDEQLREIIHSGR